MHILEFTIFNAFLWWNAREELNQYKKVAQGNFLLELNQDFFFNDRLYNLRKAIESNQPIFKTKGGGFTEQDVDDYLGTFDLIENLISSKILDENLVLDTFCDYAEEAYENQETKDYIANLRKNYPEAWGRFEDFAKRCSK